MATKKRKTVKKKFPTKYKDVPVTQGMLYEVRDELKADIRSLEKRTDAKFSKVDARFNSLDSKLEKMQSSIHQGLLLAEEQNARNKIVLDGLTSLFTRQERIEKNFIEFQKNFSFTQKD